MCHHVICPMEERSHRGAELVAGFETAIMDISTCPFKLFNYISRNTCESTIRGRIRLCSLVDT